MFAPLISAFKYRDAIDFIPDGKALDIGCGNGKFIHAMNLLGWKFEGVEFNPAAVDVCRKSGIKVFQGDLHGAAFKDNSFDLVSARHLIEHVPDPNKLIGEIARILKKGGKLIVRTPNSQALGRVLLNYFWFANDVPRHLVLFCSYNLNMLAKHYGMRPVAVKRFTTPKIILNSLDYLIKNRGKPSKKRKIRRMLAFFYVILASLTRRGDELFVIYEKS